MRKALNKYITVLDYASKTLLSVSLFSFTTVIGTSVAIAIASISIVFLVANGDVKIF